MPPQAPLGCDSFPDSPCFWRPWQFWVLLSYFVEYLSLWFCLMCFSWSHWGYRFGRKTTEVKYHSYHIISRVHTVDMTHCRWCWLPGGGIWLPGFSTVELFSHPLSCTLWEQATKHSPPLRGGEFYSSSSKGQYRHELLGIFVMGDLSLPPHLFLTYLFLLFYYYLCEYGCISYFG